MEKLEFNLGDIVYFIDDDYNYFESGIRGLQLDRKGNIYYETWDVEFEKEDIGNWVFKSELEREMHLENMFLE